VVPPARFVPSEAFALSDEPNPSAPPAISEPLVEARRPPAPAMIAPTPVPPPAPVVIAATPRDEAPAPEVRTNTRAPAKTMQDVVGPGQRKLVVAIDAGHGGKDPGAHGPTGVREKNVTMDVARELARQINAEPGMRAVLIRDGDSFVPLQQRYMRARSAQADLFISIHADASPNHTASGASVFVLSTRGASSQAARWLADQENAADLVGGVSLDEKDHNLAAVLLDLSQSATMRASDDVAGQVLGALKNVGKAHKPQVERANFVVLRSPDVPSMLVETGFITNPDEERRLNDAGYRNRLAGAITEGVRRYFSDQPPPGSYFASLPEDQRPTSRLHVVARGETLSLIAARHGVGVASIREANRRNGDTVRVGEALMIPLVATAPK
jgi:N-acetylmuramoyl-L-alanine amidase